MTVASSNPTNNSWRAAEFMDDQQGAVSPQLRHHSLIVACTGR
jgi:hypothetical protein